MYWFSAHRRMVRRGVHGLVAAAALASTAWPATPAAEGAASAEPDGKLTLKEAVEVTLARNPDLAAGAFEIGRAHV